MFEFASYRLGLVSRTGFRLGETADVPPETVGRPLEQERAEQPKMRKVSHGNECPSRIENTNEKKRKRTSLVASRRR